MKSARPRRIVRRMLAALAFTGGLATIAANTQSEASDRPEFEVVSIKPCRESLPPDGRSGGGGRATSPGRKHVQCQSVMNLIQQAYILFANGHTVNPWRHVPIFGGPAWINSDRYDIDAKAADPQSSEMMSGPMMQTLLEDRFKLRVHFETKEIPVYVLTVARSGLKMKHFKEGSCTPIDFMKLQMSTLDTLAEGVNYCSNRGGMRGELITVDADGTSLDDFAKIYLGRLDRPVINKTGVSGLFTFHLEFAPDDSTPGMLPRGGNPDGNAAGAPSADPTGGPSIFTALQEQLGLKLEPAKGPGEAIIIDHVERPTEN